MKSSESITEISGALSKFQGALENVKKNSEGYNYRYATLSQVWDMIRMPLMENGLSAIQDAKTIEGNVSVITIILHCSGQWIECGPLVIPVAKKDAHAAGSACTYAKRYGLCAALGISFVDEDDDGTAANQPDKEAEMVRNFLEKWKAEFEQETLVAFIKERATKLGVKERPIVRMYLKNSEGFQKEIQAWLEKKDKDVLNGDEAL